ENSLQLGAKLNHGRTLDLQGFANGCNTMLHCGIQQECPSYFPDGFFRPVRWMGSGVLSVCAVILVFENNVKGKKLTFCGV
ncbi:MAG: hypothetical protein ACYC67_18320, partial [Prosthecobacter sp.]